MADIGNVFILGDSYSTFEGFIPEGYEVYYKKNGADYTDVEKVEQTWWYKILLETESVLVKNCSYSGTTMCNTGYNGNDCSDISFVGRLDALINEGFFSNNKIDTFFLFGGTNDSAANSPVGNPKYENWTKDDLFSVIPAFCYMINRVKCHSPETKIICVINTELKEDITNGMKAACEKYNTVCVELKDIDKMKYHPTVKGMEQIKEQVLACMM